MRKITFLKTLLLAIVMMVGSASVSGQGTLSSPIFSENFGTLADATTITTSNTAFSYVRVGTVSGSYIKTKNPGSFTDASGLVKTASGSISTIDKTGLTSFSSGTFTFKFKTPSSLTGAAMISAVGTGASFGSSSGFTGAQLSSGFQVTGTNLQIRATGAWTTVQTVAVSTTYTVTIVFNNTAGTLTYGDAKSLPSNKCHVWVNGTYVNEYATATASLAASAFRIYCTTAEFEVDDIAVYNTLPALASTPTLSVTPTSLTGFAYNYGSGPSTEKTFTVGGSNLTNNITLTAPADYEISTTTGGAFAATSPITLTQTGGTVATTTIYARLKAGLAVGNYNLENIAITSTGATAASVACNGSVACVASGIAFAAPTVNKLLSDAAFTLTPTTSSTGAITYSSATPAVATVDASTGLVTLLTAGSTVITASQVADVTYCAATATYTLNVAPTTPTITVPENTIADFAANVGSTNQKTANVSGINLTAGITLALSGTNAGLFSLSASSVAQSGGTAANTPITITYTPTSSGSHTATLTLSSAGATDVTRTLTATAGLDTPVAYNVNGNNSAFTANWDIVPGATSYQLDVYTKSGGAPVTVTEGFDAGFTAPTDWTFTAIGGTYTTATNFGALSPSIKFDAIADAVLTPVLLSSATELSFWMKGQSATGSSLLVEGYNGSTWVQIDNIITPVGTGTTYLYTSASTPALPNNITQFRFIYTKVAGNISFDDVTYKYGSLGITPITGSPFTVTGANSKQLTGLNGGTTYFYTVTAKDATSSSAVSDEKTGNTLATAIDQTNSVLAISAVNGKIVLRAIAGETINVYNAIGQKILSKSSIDGLNTFTVAAHGVVMVKVGNRVGKVIL